MQEVKDGLNKLQIYKQVTSSGIIGIPTYTVKAESIIRVTLESNATGSTVDVYGKIGEAAFVLIGSITGNDSDIFDFSTYDFARFVCSTFSQAFNIYVAGFVQITSSQTVDAINDLDDALVQDGISATVATSTTAVELIVGATPRAGRKGLYIMANNANNFLGFSSTMTAAQGLTLPNGQILYIEAKDTAQVYVRRSAGVGSVNIWEVI